MELTIISPVSKKTHKIVWLELNTPAGNFIIQPGHAPTILILLPQKKIIFRLESGKQESILLTHGGTAKITRNSATVLANV